ncbi:MAG: vitamin K epoxide reductase family protein [Fimbriimonadaceae bacterium]|nr:vitamin K epoxide reductase family protein [Chthonomonadaceae bacterium]MCO5298011.1 vitamin K epoxide reductase family protein [Fimbriimonadaceae bacterium]
MTLTQWNRITLVLAFAGLFVAGVLSLSHVLNIVPPCGASGGCETVANHPSSKWFGVPVAYFGFLAYLVLGALGAARSYQGVGRSRRLIAVGYALSAVGTVVSLVLTFYAISVIRATCLWCLASAGIMVLNMAAYAILAQRAADVKPDEAGPDANDAGTTFDFKLLVGLGLALLVSLGMMSASMDSRSKLAAFDKKGMASLTAADFAPEGVHALGPVDAPITIVEFGDLMCHACRSSFPEVRAFQQEHPTKVRWIYRHYPLYQNPSHQLSLPAAFIAEYASETGKFWQALEMIYGGESEPQTVEELFAMAQALNLNVEDLKKRMDDSNDPIYARIQADLKIANDAGFMETPTFALIQPGKEIAVANARSLSVFLAEDDVQKVLKGDGG